MVANNITNQIVQSIKKDHADAEVILFGSRARNDAKEDSDWDILVLLNQPKVSFRDEQKIRHKIYDIELEEDVSISIFAFAKKEWEGKQKFTPFYNNVKTDGIFL